MDNTWAFYRRKLNTSETAFNIFARTLVGYIASDNCMPMRGRDWLSQSRCKNDVEWIGDTINELEETYRMWFWEAFEELDPLYDPTVVECFKVLRDRWGNLKEHSQNKKQWPVNRSTMSLGKNHFVRGLRKFHIQAFGSPFYGTITHIWNALFPDEPADKEQIVQICRNQPPPTDMFLVYFTDPKTGAQTAIKLEEFIDGLEEMAQAVISSRPEEMGL